MKSLRMTLAALTLSGLSSLALAAGNPLSVHVLNLENGLPSPGVNVTLEKHVDNGLPCWDLVQLHALLRQYADPFLPMFGGGDEPQDLHL